jgi:hypothetical protein
MCAIFDHVFEFEIGGASNSTTKPVMLHYFQAHFSEQCLIFDHPVRKSAYVRGGVRMRA